MSIGLLGNLVSVYTPRSNITGCELTSNGRHIALAVEGEDQVLFLQLKGPNLLEDHEEDEAYGLVENSGKTFNLNDSDTC